ncbi:hypothetical protein C4K05_2974 [Pseudomonas chlororaphis subsp. aureofaciens]|uniref:Uncharacterized protein n=1 Tax=Pseudomonas chlororaphis subsp. aureofaciens TaxID=587851 RepID=A0AAD0ZIU7_9PSED|nr:hypothetical protein C4K14_3073 [Pseudomonas chlororaphis subsp. aureofaciens]AZD98841.1 hypothetical protein C4K12_2975 [Pseudomonas chlororaphis subsp. aureofaciens]AZE05041.1 hypothetical protein C4K11_2879 [Pseudomonas chlororaphis subsp. aureofaciens]AZE11199.1 hypothetical protein C4K10_2919 [Pseudomonas chlororaphis subsp. aureofaciens]AZE17211.1 hypothetical protein C4K09_2750 [Pseudomonas chlororaphis subsp. aureofaciens]
MRHKDTDSSLERTAPPGISQGPPALTDETATENLAARRQARIARRPGDDKGLTNFLHLIPHDLRGSFV